MTEDDVSVDPHQTIDWDGARWNFLGDPKMRMRDSAPLFVTARDAVVASFANPAEF